MPGTVTISDSRYGKKRNYTMASSYKGYRGRQNPMSRYSSRTRVVKTPYVSRAGASLVRKVDNALNNTHPTGAEIKTIENALPSIAIDNDITSNGVFHLVNFTTQGSQNYAREGLRINLKSLRITGWLDISQQQTDFNALFVDNFVRMIVVYTKDKLTAAPAWNTIFGGNTTTGGDVSNTYSALRPDKMNNWFVLRDKWFFKRSDVPIMAIPDTTLTSHNTYPVDEYIDLGGLLTVQPKNLSGSVADIESGALYVCFIAHHNDVPTSAALFHGNARLRFTDV